MHVASLHVYPVKGARGIELASSDVLASGLRHDRRFMVVEDNGSFVTQREHPRMALVDVVLERDRIVVSVGGDEADVPLAPTGPRRRVRVWNDEVDAIDVGGEGAALFSDLLERPCSLVYMPLDVVRAVEARHARPGDRVGFADAYPVLVASLSSLADLGVRLVNGGGQPLPMNRFRPNIVVAGGAPYAEDHATSVRIGALSLRTPKRCARCKVTTIDQETAEAGKEPLRTLASYRRAGAEVHFAMNAIPDLSSDASATIRTGDAVSYTSRA